MIFLFKKKPIVLTCITDNHHAMTMAPVQRAIKFIPDWWKSLPSSYKIDDDFYSSATMKHCAGFVDLYKNGVITPMWSDLALEIGQRGSTFYRYQFSDGRSNAVQHISKQYQNYFDESKYQHLKIVSPWLFYCDEEINFMFSGVTWSSLRFSTITTLPGVINFKYQSSANINLLIRRTDQVQEILIPFHEPVCHIIPLSDRPLKLVLSNDDKLFKERKTLSSRSTFLRAYDTNKKAWKKFEEGK